MMIHCSWIFSHSSVFNIVLRLKLLGFVGIYITTVYMKKPLWNGIVYITIAALVRKFHSCAYSVWSLVISMLTMYEVWYSLWFSVFRVTLCEQRLLVPWAIGILPRVFGFVGVPAVFLMGCLFLFRRLVCVWYSVSSDPQFHSEILYYERDKNQIKRKETQIKSKWLHKLIIVLDANTCFFTCFLLQDNLATNEIGTCCSYRVIFLVQAIGLIYNLMVVQCFNLNIKNNTAQYQPQL